MTETIETLADRARELELDLRAEIDRMLKRQPLDAAGADTVRALLNAESGCLRAYSALLMAHSIAKGWHTAESLCMLGQGVGIDPWDDHNKIVGASLGMAIGRAVSK